MRIWVMFAVVLIIVLPSMALVVGVGTGLPEAVNIGLHTGLLKKIELGGTGCYMPFSSGSFLTLGADGSYIFKGVSPVNVSSWFIRSGVMYSRDESASKIEKFLFLPIGGGRRFGLCKNLALNADLALLMKVWHKEKIKRPPGWWTLNFDFNVYPAFRIQLLWEFLK